jgi:hypothetical protein
MIIDGTYFKGTTSIDGLNVDTGAPSITRTAMKDYLDSFIDTYERVSEIGVGKGYVPSIHKLHEGRRGR